MTTHPLLSKERFGGKDLWSVTPQPGQPIIDELRQASNELARRGGGLLHWWVTAPSPEHEQAAEAAGFNLYRRLHRMERPLPVTDEPYDLSWRPFRPGVDDAAWLEVNRLSFSNHPIQGTMVQEDLDRAKVDPTFDPEGFVITSEGGQMTGFCWTKIHHDAKPLVGEIYIIGAHPNCQGRGLGRALVLAGLNWLHGQGLTLGMLYVEANNDPAVRLYLRLGFEIVHDFRCWRCKVEAA
ncbi:mycothiol synthase [Candidatus Entotheonella palauensis]|nr:mycothiol synthase [Candidatus Entotheonella palauensis]